ncbi:hypothetical protein [Streptomyces decoyicus]|uniref:hypothetical protein n=1 Tax=Streptomyces decoyicus TaxID=249567 RepID=UPI000B1A5C48|nr:hypothetical protein [Streptomyces decoyicus]
MGEQEFHGNRSAERLVEGPPDLPHRAPSDGIPKPVPARYKHLFFTLIPKDVLIAIGHHSPREARIKMGVPQRPRGD